MTKVLTGQRNTRNEHACTVCCVPIEDQEALECNVSPTNDGSEREVGFPQCLIGDPAEFVHSHPEGEPTVSDKDIETSNDNGVPVTVVEPGGRGSTYEPNGGIDHFSHNK